VFSRAGAVIVPALFLSIHFPTFVANISTSVTNPSAQLPNETYFDGLRRADAGTIEAVYNEFRKPITRAVEAAGGSSADGSTFFRVALLQTASMAHHLQLQESTPLFFLLKNLAVAHFRDWALEKNVPLPEPPPVSEEEATYSIELPGAEDRLQFRQHVRARRQFSKLSADCQKRIQELAKDTTIGISDPRLAGKSSETCLEQYRQNLGETEHPWAGLPPWVVTALADEHFQQSWSIAESLENRLSMGQSSAADPESKITRNVLIALGLLLFGYGLWVYFRPAAAPEVVYEENFKPPASIMADRAARAAHDTLPLERIEVCEQLFEEADEAYKRKSYTEAASVLYTMIGEEMEGCNSDALFYLAIIGLELGEPEVTLDCLAKIPDLDRFGEDLYWYQALAFVKIAAQNPLRRDIARRAVERARSNTEIPERRAQAEKMLEKLAE
jgi:hypothetical protein